MWLGNRGKGGLGGVPCGGRDGETRTAPPVHREHFHFIHKEFPTIFEAAGSKAAIFHSFVA